MAITSTLFYHASCDGGCEAKYVDDNSDNENLVLARTPVQLSEYLRQEGWLEHQGKVFCPECIDTLDTGQEHDFVTTARSEPFCAICKQLPDGAHPNVPMYGQDTIFTPREGAVTPYGT